MARMVRELPPRRDSVAPGVPAADAACRGARPRGKAGPRPGKHLSEAKRRAWPGRYTRSLRAIRGGPAERAARLARLSDRSPWLVVQIGERAQLKPGFPGYRVCPCHLDRLVQVGAFQ